MQLTPNGWLRMKIEERQIRQAQLARQLFNAELSLGTIEMQGLRNIAELHACVTRAGNRHRTLNVLKVDVRSPAAQIDRSLDV
jgi:hypothetical protein